MRYKLIAFAWICLAGAWKELEEIICGELVKLLPGVKVGKN